MKKEKARVAFFDTKPYDREFFDAANRKFGFDITYFETRLHPASARMAAGFDAVCAFVNDDLSKDTIEVLHEEGVEAIAMRCAGYNNVDLAAAFGRIMVMRVPGYSPYAVAEYTLGMLLTLNRSLHRAYNRVRDNNFSINGFLGFDLRGKTFGIIGTGKIGRVFAELLQGFGVRILGYDMYPSQEAAEKLHIEYVPLETLYRESDVISLHCPLTPENVYMINAESIAQMKDGVYIINTSRGKLIDTAALIAGLKSRKIGGAGLDVYEERANTSLKTVPMRRSMMTCWRDSSLSRMCWSPPIRRFSPGEALTNIADVTLSNLKAFFDGGELVNCICMECDGTRQCPGKAPDAPPCKRRK